VQGCAFDVFDHVGPAVGDECVSGGREQVGVAAAGAVVEVAVGLARRRGVDGVVFVAVFGEVGEGVALVEGERVVGLGVEVDAGDVEACLVVAGGGSACAAEQVEESGLHRCSP
jgi:hypothetical protein